MTPEEFCQRVYQIPLPEDIAYFILEFFDDQFWLGRFKECNQVLETLDVNRMNVQALVSTLCFTYCAREQLPYRETFKEQARLALVKLVGAERTERLLRNK